MVWRLLTHYGMNKATAIADEFAAAVVAFDPETASKAQVALMETELTKLGNRLAEAEAELQREHQETLALKQSYQQHLEAAGLLENKLSAEEDAAEAEELEASLARIVEKLERMKPEIEREEREDREVELWRAELRRSFEELAAKIRRAHSELKTARRQMDMAQIQKERAAEQGRRASELSGLPGKMSSLSVALEAMNRETAKVRAETEALKLKADALSADKLDGDPNIAAVLDAVRGKPAIDRRGLSRRLAALNGRGRAEKLDTAA